MNSTSSQTDQQVGAQIAAKQFIIRREKETLKYSKILIFSLCGKKKILEVSSLDHKYLCSDRGEVKTLIQIMTQCSQFERSARLCNSLLTKL